ncbi:HepT-like ribonuclease domain-containing protein [Propionimicrobium sp. PCR01-08-3]
MGLRNILVHQYTDIDLAQVAAAVPLALRDYGEYIRQVSRKLI